MGQAHIQPGKIRFPPSRPLLLYDGHCRFCRRWAARMLRFTRGQIQCVPFQQQEANFPEIAPRQFEHSVQFLDCDGTVFSGAAAAFKTLSYRKGLGWLLWLYRRWRIFAALSESSYNLVSANRYRLH